MTDFSPRLLRITVATVLILMVVAAAGWPTHSAEPPTPAAAEPAAAPETASPNGAPARSQPAKAAANGTGLDAAAAVEIQRRFNELRRELLESRMKRVDWWLAATAIFLTLLGVVAVIAGYIGFRRFREIEAEARGAAQSLIDEIKAKRDEAAEALERVNAQDVSDAPNEADRAAASVQKNPQASPIEQAIAAAILLQRRGNTEGAIEKWRAVANVVDGADNKDLAARAWFSVGYLLQESNGDLESSIDAYDKAIQLKPDMVAAYNNRGNVNDNLGRYEHAIVDYDEAIRLKPDYAKACYNRGNAKYELGQYEYAVADYDKAIRLKPDYVEAYCNRGVAKKKLDRGGDAIVDYDEAIRLKPDYAEAYYNRGITRGELVGHEAAIVDYDEAVRLKPDMVEAYDNRGTAKHRLNRHEDAIMDYNEAIRLKPDYAEAYKNRGLASFDLNRGDRGRRDLETALALARKAGDETLAETVSRSLNELFGKNGS